MLFPGVVCPLTENANDTLARLEGGIGSQPLRSDTPLAPKFVRSSADKQLVTARVGTEKRCSSRRRRYAYWGRNDNRPQIRSS